VSVLEMVLPTPNRMVWRVLEAEHDVIVNILLFPSFCGGNKRCPLGLPPAVRMLYWLHPSPQKRKSTRLAMNGGRFLGVAGGN